MPIRFRCVYCDKLLGIARRKAGAVVDCPHCAEKLIVPTPDSSDAASHADEEAKGTEEAEAIATAAGKQKLFEQSDFDALMGEGTFRTIDVDDGPTVPKPPPSYVQPAAVVPVPATPAGHPMHPGLPPLRQGMFISSAKAMWLSVAAVIVPALAFGIGLIVGRMMK